jgi:hypothetical protein
LHDPARRSNTTAKLSWILSLCSDLGLSLTHPPTLWCDNIGATYLTSNPVFHARTKHIEIDFHFVRDTVSKKILRIQFISSKDQLADIFTKPLFFARLAFLRSNLNVLPLLLRLQGRVKDISSPQLDIRSQDRDKPKSTCSQDHDKSNDKISHSSSNTR